MGYNSTGVVKWVEPAAGDRKLKMEDLVTIQRFHFYMYDCFAYMHVCVACMCSAQAEDTGSLGTRVTAHGELLCGCWELTLGPLQQSEHPQLLSQPSRPRLGSLKHTSISMVGGHHLGI